VKTHVAIRLGLAAIALAPAAFAQGHGEPDADFKAFPKTGTAPYDALFEDLSVGQITTWLWDFGDGTTSTAQQPTHRYELPGTYDVSLTVAGPFGVSTHTKLAYMHAAPPPLQADFTANVNVGTYPLTVDFQDLTSGFPEQWLWTFGDNGASSTEQNPTHTYTTPGSYLVQLQVQGYGLLDTENKADFVEVHGEFVKLGCQVDTFDTMLVLSGATPKIGTTVTFGVDNPYGTQNPGAIPIIVLSQGPAPNTPCGLPVPGVGMNGGGSELLIRPGAFMLRPALVGSAWPGPGVPAQVTFPIPNIPAVLGHSLWSQGFLFDPTSGLRLSFASGFELRFDV